MLKTVRSAILALVAVLLSIALLLGANAWTVHNMHSATAKSWWITAPGVAYAATTGAALVFAAALAVAVWATFALPRWGRTGVVLLGFIITWLMKPPPWIATAPWFSQPTLNFHYGAFLILIGVVGLLRK